MKRSLPLAAAILAVSTLSLEALARQSSDDLNPPKSKRPTKADKKAAKRNRRSAGAASVSDSTGKGEQRNGE